MEEYEAHVR
jgi:hypothetical protein